MTGEKSPGSFRFETFTLDVADRQLRQDGAPVELNARYFDALALLVREQGKLVSKDRFLDEVWRGVPVTDEALTQCIRTLRRALGDDAARPRFIETVPKHGYRFVAPIHPAGGADATATASGPPSGESRELHARRHFLALGAAGAAGGGVAGLIGGLFYGFGASSQPLDPGMGAVSVLLVLVCLTFLVGLMGGAGVGFGIAASAFRSGRIGPWSPVGAAAGGLAVGALVKLLGLDAFQLLLGQSPGDITGAGEGALLGAAVGLGFWWASRTSVTRLSRRGIAAATLLCGVAGTFISLSGGRLMGGSLDLLARHFPASRLRLDQIGALFGENGLGPISQVVTAGLESALFGGCVVAAMLVASREAAWNNRTDAGSARPE